MTASRISSDKDQTVLSMRKMGHSVPSIAIAMKESEFWVKNRVYKLGATFEKLGVKPLPSFKERQEKLWLDIVRIGQQLDQISVKHGIKCNSSRYGY